MANGILICGANGSGKSTLGKELAAALHYKHIDIEDYYFIRSDIPYSKSRTRKEVCNLILKDIEKYHNFVLSAVNGDMGEEINSTYKLAVYLSAPLVLRLERVKQRSYERFGNRVLAGGDMYEQEQKFFDYVATHSTEKAEKAKVWLSTLSCPVIEADGTKDIDGNVKWLTDEIDRIEKGGIRYAGKNGYFLSEQVE